MSLSVRLERGSQTFTLNGQPLARGGEATIYEVPGQPSLVAKVYHQPTADHAAKVAAMIAAPPSDPMAGRGHVSIAWPLDRLLDAAAPRFLGYVMPRVDKVRPILEFYNPASRLELCPLFHYGYLLRTARNLAAAVRAIHERGYVIGDLNESNALVSNMALVTLVDTDSFQVPGSQQVFRCPVGKPEYTPPELQGARFADFDRGPEHDAFALAILIFQLLMAGIHPFAGRYIDVGEPGGLSERISAGHWPYALRRRVPYAPNPHAPPFETLPPRVQELMRRCFEDGHARSALRPDAAAWYECLLESEKEMVACPARPKQHVFHRQLKACPWCALAARQGRDLFPSEEDVQAGRVGVRPAPAKATEVVQVALAPAPMARDLPGREVPVTAVATASRSGPVAAPPPLPRRPSDLDPPSSRPSDLAPSRDMPASAPQLSWPSGPVTVPRDEPIVLDFDPPPSRRRLPWHWVAGAAAGVLVLGVVLALVFSGGWPPNLEQKAQVVPNKKGPPEKAGPPPSRLFPNGQVRFLSELPEFDVRPGEWPFKKGDIGDGKPIKVGGVPSPHGLGMHPPMATFRNPPYAAVKYRLEKEAELLKATVAVDDSTQWCWSPATFTVLGDGKELWKSGEIAHNHARSQECQVVVKGVDVLELRVQVLNGNKGVHAVWVEPRVLQKFDSPDLPGKEEAPKQKDGGKAAGPGELGVELAALLKEAAQVAEWQVANKLVPQEIRDRRAALRHREGLPP